MLRRRPCHAADRCFDWLVRGDCLKVGPNVRDGRMVWLAGKADVAVVIANHAVAAAGEL